MKRVLTWLIMYENHRGAESLHVPDFLVTQVQQHPVLNFFKIFFVGNECILPYPYLNEMYKISVIS